jgi:hypothetical protein
VNILASWLQFNIRDVLIATALLAIGLVWPILFFVIVPIIVAGVLARMRSRAPLAHALYVCAVSYPWMLLTLLYLVWGIAWYRSGSRPIPYETELGLNPPFDNLVFLAIWLMGTGLPIAFLLGLVALIFTADPNSRSPEYKPIARAIVLVCVWIGSVLWSIADPGQPIEWFFD